jgi:hypothetical protein
MMDVKTMENHCSNRSADSVKGPVERPNQPPIPSLGVWKEGFCREEEPPSHARFADQKDQPNNHA